MTKLALSAAALLALGSPAPAATSDDDAWIKLDQEINSLSASIGRQEGGIEVGALIKSSYVEIDDDLVSVPSADDTGPVVVTDLDEDLGGFVFQDVDVWVEGQVGDFDWRVSIDFDGGKLDGDNFFDTFLMLKDVINPSGGGSADGGPADPADQIDIFLGQNPGAFGALTSQSLNTGGSADLEDAYGTWNFTENAKLTFGQFKSPVLLSQMVDESNQILINRTILGSAFDNWQLGAMLHGGAENFAWFLAMQNGQDGLADDYRYTARAEFYINEGAGGRSRAGGRTGYEGAYGAAQEISATVGVAYREDDGFERGLRIIAVDGAATMGPFSLAAELIDFDLDRTDDPGTGLPRGDEGGAMMAFTMGFMLSPDEWEGALRYENIDEVFDTKKVTAGVNYYQNGHNAKWSLNISDIDADELFIDGTLIELGLSVGSSRS